jgi:NTP pyrophosphatase (non-canonical NTP hydrolase)
MEIKELVQKAHSNAVNKGFYDCDFCHGTGEYSILGMAAICDECEGSGNDFDANVAEKLMLIVSELSEALEAHRTNKMMCVPISRLDPDNIPAFAFENQIKDTFEDEIADVFIRLGDLCGWLNIDIDAHIKAKMEYNAQREHKHGKAY